MTFTLHPAASDLTWKLQNVPMPWISEAHPVLGLKAATEIEGSMSKSNRDDMLGVMTIAIAGSRICGIEDDDSGLSVSSATIAVLLVCLWCKIRGIYGARRSHAVTLFLLLMFFAASFAFAVLLCQ